ncbi:aldolase/citrate lyase family protein [Sphaerisporangium sp. NPDC051011]|uniref:HpcH/HpaI aldolase family protein n=1 Tax=Sphaerisporangium sp. NPDC051011 TaxID=3155792 RepID=UPI0033DCBB7F
MNDPTNPAAARGLRAWLAAGETLIGAWSTLPSTAAASLIARAGGIDYFVTDLQHGSAGEADLPGICAAVSSQGVTPLARVRSSTVGDIGRALDLGAHGVFLPNVYGVEHVAEVLGFCRYAPTGVRSYGPLMPGAEDPLRFIVLETREALGDLDQILDLDGLDGVYIGPVDLACALGHAATPHDKHMAGIIADVVRRCIDRGVAVGVHTGEGHTAAEYRKGGARLVNALTDAVVLTDAAVQHTRLARGTR